MKSRETPLLTINRMKLVFFTVRSVILPCLIILITYTAVWGAVGCDLNDPDRDVARLFPESTGYKTVYTSIQKKGGDKLLSTVETRLGDKFHGIYETIDVPYTIYEIFANKKKIGYIHGVNQKGQFGGIQVFLVLDLEGTIKGFYIQKMTSQYAAKLRDVKTRRRKPKPTSWRRSGPRRRTLSLWMNLFILQRVTHLPRRRPKNDHKIPGSV
jgi:hypothetical protein